MSALDWFIYAAGYLAWGLVGSFLTYRALRAKLWRIELDATIYRQLAADLERGVERNVEPRLAVWILRPAFVAAGIHSDALERSKQHVPHDC